MCGYMYVLGGLYLGRPEQLAYGMRTGDDENVLQVEDCIYSIES